MPKKYVLGEVLEYIAGIEQYIAVLERQLAEAQATIAALQWMKITPDNPPTTGDEVAEYIFATYDEPAYWLVESVTEYGYSCCASHRRLISPPAQDSATEAEQRAAEGAR
jgi:hypothetical protein